MHPVLPHSYRSPFSLVHWYYATKLQFIGNRLTIKHALNFISSYSLHVFLFDFRRSPGTLSKPNTLRSSRYCDVDVLSVILKNNRNTQAYRIYESSLKTVHYVLNMIHRIPYNMVNVNCTRIVRWLRVVSA